MADLISKEYDIARHYNLEHKQSPKTTLPPWEQKGQLWKGDFKCLQKTSIDHSYALQTRHHVAHFLAKESKPFYVTDLIRKCLQHTVQEIYLEKELFLIL